MQKTEIVHTRISPETKAECDYIFNKLGITTSYAITMFLNQVSLRKGLHCEDSFFPHLTPSSFDAAESSGCT